MAEFLQHLETIRAEEASVQNLFGSEGQSVRKGRRSPQYMANLAEAATFMTDIYQGREPLWKFNEAMTTSDFPLLFTDIIDRQVLSSYKQASYSWGSYARRGTVRDFRAVKRHFTDGAEGVLSSVKETAEYPEASLTEGEYSYAVKKYGRRIPMSWELMINDDVGAFRDLPERLGKAARRSEEKFVTELFAGTTGPKASTFTAIVGNPALSITALQSAMSVLLTQKDADNEPIAVEQMTLVVPPQLQVTAQNILNATSVQLGIVGQGADAAPASETRLVTSNWLRGQGIVNAVTNFYLPVVSTTNGDTSWYLMASPAAGRPAMEIGFLIGHESPEIFRQSPNAMRVGSNGLIDPMNGSFENDSIHYKVRHVFGGAIFDKKMIVASNGSGS